MYVRGLSFAAILGRPTKESQGQNRTGENPPSGIVGGLAETSPLLGAGLRPIGKPMELPPDPTVACAPHFYPDHMREQLKPMLFDDEQLEEASAARASPVLKAIRSTHAKAKDASKAADDALPLHSFRTLLMDLGTLAYNVTYTHLNPEAKIVVTTRPTPIQSKAFKLLGINPACTQ